MVAFRRLQAIVVWVFLRAERLVGISRRVHLDVFPDVSFGCHVRHRRDARIPQVPNLGILLNIRVCVNAPVI